MSKPTIDFSRYTRKDVLTVVGVGAAVVAIVGSLIWLFSEQPVSSDNDGHHTTGITLPNCSHHFRSVSKTAKNATSRVETVLTSLPRVQKQDGARPVLRALPFQHPRHREPVPEQALRHPGRSRSASSSPSCKRCAHRWSKSRKTSFTLLDNSKRLTWIRKPGWRMRSIV
jgi:hypothetical protein